MRDSKKNAVFIAILLVLLMISSAIVDNIMSTNDSFVNERNKCKYNIRDEKENTLDVLVVGDSLSYTAVSPMVLWKNYGITGYVCGQAGQRADEAFYLLKNVYKTQKPKLVIIETNMLFGKRTQLSAIGDGIESTANYYMSVFEGHDIWKSLVFKRQYNNENYKGFFVKTNVAPYTNGEYMVESNQQENLPENVRLYMDKIIKLCEKNDTQILLLSSPSPKNCNYAKHNGLVAYAAEKGLAYLDLNLKTDEIGIDWTTDSLDMGDHLNLSGGDKVSQCLGEYLSSNYTLTDHRSDKLYSDWEDVLAVYEERTSGEIQKIRGAT